jgi:hypothetical protein
LAAPLPFFLPLVLTGSSEHPTSDRATVDTLMTVAPRKRMTDGEPTERMGRTLQDGPLGLAPPGQGSRVRASDKKRDLLLSTESVAGWRALVPAGGGTGSIFCCHFGVVAAGAAGE